MSATADIAGGTGELIGNAGELVVTLFGGLFELLAEAL